MKNLLLSILSCLLLSSMYQVNAQTYDSNDKEGLRIFLRQPSSDAGVSNFAVAGLSVSDTVSWYASEAWVAKIKSPEGNNACEWNSDSPKRVTFLNLIGYQSTRKFAGSLDCRKFTLLDGLWAWGNKLSAVNISDMYKLRNADVRTNNLTQLDASNCTALSSFVFGENPLTSVNLNNTMALTSVNGGATLLTTLDLSNRTQLATLLCHESKLTNLNLRNTPALIELRCQLNGLTNLDLSNHPVLENIFASDNQLSFLNLENTPALAAIFVQNNKLTGIIDLSNHSKLQYVNINTNKINGCNVANTPLLETLECGDAPLTMVDLTNTPSLTRLNVSASELTSLDVSGHQKLATLMCHDSYLKSLNITNTPSLQELTCWNAYLKFSTLPIFNGPVYRYSGQRTIDGGTIPYNWTVDLTSEYNIRGNITTYEWFDEGWSPLTLQNPAPGKFIPGATLEGRLINCIMTNAAYPDLRLQYQVRVTGAKLRMLEHLTLVESPRQDIYAAESGQIFKVYANTEALPENVKIGLFKTTGGYVQDINISRVNKLYTCVIPSTIESNTYMIQPYTLDLAGDRKIIERIEGTPVIDKLPFATIRNYQGLQATQVQSHLVLNTSEKYLHKVYIGETFEVLANISVTPGTRIGLFELDGHFVEDLTQSISGIQYTCKVSDSVYPNRYIIMPYEVINGTERIVERASGAAIMDRLPVVVDYRYSQTARSSVAPASIDLGQNETSVTVYPNPATEIIHVNTQDAVNNISIYSLQGALIKQAANTTSITVREIPSGVYIVKVSTSSGESAFKIKKN